MLRENPGTVRVVSRLRQDGWSPCDNRDGLQHDLVCDRDYACVLVHLPSDCDLRAECHRMLAWVQQNVKAERRHIVRVAGCYDPLELLFFVELQGLLDEDLHE